MIRVLPKILSAGTRYPQTPAISSSSSSIGKAEGGYTNCEKGWVSDGGEDKPWVFSGGDETGDRRLI